MKNASLVMKKELARVFKDKRMIFSMFILPALIMLVIFNLVGMMVDGMSKDVEEHVSTVYIQNATESAKNVIAASGYDKAAKVSFVGEGMGTIDKIKDEILSGDTDLLVVFDTDFDEVYKAYKKSGDAIPNISLYYNSTTNYGNAAVSTFNAMVATPLRTGLQSERIGNLEQLTVFNIEETIIANEDKKNGQFLSMMLPYMIVMMLFASAMSLCVDAVAGEKERGTLATLLLSPIKRSEIAFGKLAGLSILASISAVVYAISSIFSMGSMSKSIMGVADDAGDMGKLSFTAWQVIGLVLIMITLVYLFVAITSLLSILAKDIKQASSLISPLYIVVILLGMITMFTTGKTPADFMYAIPVYGSALAIQGIAVNDLEPLQLIFSICGNVVCAAVVTFGIKKAFDSEKVMFNA